MGGEVGGKIMVYNTRMDQKKRGQRKKTRKERERERERESKRLKKYNSKKEEFSTLDHITRACPRILFACVHV